MSAKANPTVMTGRATTEAERIESRPTRRKLAQRLRLHEDRVGFIPDGLAAWTGSAIFWTLLAWFVFGWG
jgi:hypothetical protein